MIGVGEGFPTLHVPMGLSVTVSCQVETYYVVVGVVGIPGSCEHFHGSGGRVFELSFSGSIFSLQYI